MQWMLRLLASLVMVSPIQADLINESRPGPPALAQQVDEKLRNEAIQLIADSKLNEARALVEGLREKNKDLPHTDLVLAEWLVQVGRAPAAINLLEELAAKSPPRKDIHYSFARIAIAQGRVFDAATHLEKVDNIGFDPKWSPEYRAEFDRSVRETKGQIAERRGNWDEAYAIYSSLLEQKPGAVNLRFGLARTAFYAKKLDVAEQQFRLLEQAQTPPTIAELVIARLFDSIRDKENCEVWFKKGVSRSENAPVSAEYARWLIRNHRGEDALELTKPFESDGSKKWEFLFIKAQALQKIGKFEESEPVLKNLVEANPEFLGAALHLAWALSDSSDVMKRQSAKDLAANTMTRLQNAPIAIATLAWAQFRAGDEDEAWTTMSKCPANNLQQDIVYFLARMRESKGESANAKSLFDALRKAEGDFFHESRMPMP
jgi:predicted Zn-dependent protease